MMTTTHTTPYTSNRYGRTDAPADFAIAREIIRSVSWAAFQSPDGVAAMRVIHPHKDGFAVLSTDGVVWSWTTTQGTVQTDVSKIWKYLMQYVGWRA